MVMLTERRSRTRSEAEPEADEAGEPETEIIDPRADHDEVLELTEMVNADGTVTDLSNFEYFDQNADTRDTALEESDDGEPVGNEAEAGTENLNFEKEFVITDADAPKPPAGGETDLVSDRPAVETAGAFASLAGAVSASQGVPIGNANKTLEDLVKELLRPMLREWLDDNLPPLVERLVEREINKLAGLNEKK